MRRVIVIAAIAITALVLNPRGTLAASARPWHTIAVSSPISATGYRARVQVRPPSTGSVIATYTWIGGYLVDGTFVQSGIGQPSPSLGSAPMAFVWFQRAGSTPLWLALPGAAVGDWYEFTATLAGGSWTFRVTTPTGATLTQLTVASTSRLAVVETDHENWMEAWGPIPTGAMRSVAILTGAWTIPHLAHGTSAPQCGTEEIVPTPGLNLVFRYVAGGGAPCYTQLS